MNLNIEADPEPAAPAGFAPTFVDKPKIDSSADGKKVTMWCSVKADPRPSVEWTREGVVVKESSRLSITVVQQKDVYAIKLELNDPNPTDAGLYKCSVKNVHGQLNANLTLNIESTKQYDAAARSDLIINNKLDLFFQLRPSFRNVRKSLRSRRSERLSSSAT